MRAASGMGWGAVYGAAGGVLANLALVVVVVLSSLLANPGDAGTAFGLGMLIVIFGSVVAAILGCGVGAAAGLLLGALRIERHAPIAATIATVGFPLVTMASSLREEFVDGGLGAIENYAVGVLGLVGFAAAGYIAGSGFSRSSSLGTPVRRIEGAPVQMPYDTVAQPADDFRPAVSWQRTLSDSPLAVVQPGEQQDDPPAGGPGLQ